MIRGVTFNKSLLKSEDIAHQMNYFYQGKFGVSKGCAISVDVNGDIVIADGYFSIYGRLIKNEGNTIVDVPTVASGTLYSILVFEIDLNQENTVDTFNQGKFKIISNGTAYPALTQQDLDNGGTLYQMEFARFENKSTGISSLVDKRTILSLSMYALQSYVDAQLSLKASKTADFLNSLSTNGYQKLPNGLILQWGYYVPDHNAILSEKINLPIAFPNNFINVWGSFSAQDVNTNPRQIKSYIDKNGTSKSQFVLRVQDNDTSISSRWCYWFAIGN